MKYYMTDFYTKEIFKKIKELEDKNRYIYSLIDTGCIHYQICSKNSICNRFGFIITDVPLLKNCRDIMTDEEFSKIGFEEDEMLIM